MRYRLSPAHPWTRYEGDDASDGDGNPCRESEPTLRSPLVDLDLTDPATVGCLAAWCREVYGDRWLHATPTIAHASWRIAGRSGFTVVGRDSLYVEPAGTEGAAWALAILDKLEAP
jgi:hypothetical protein